MLIIILLSIVLLLYLFLIYLKNKFKGNKNIEAVIYFAQMMIWILIAVVNWIYIDTRIKIIFIAVIIISFVLGVLKLLKK